MGAGKAWVSFLQGLTEIESFGDCATKAVARPSAFGPHLTLRWPDGRTRRWFGEWIIIRTMGVGRIAGQIRPILRSGWRAEVR